MKKEEPLSLRTAKTLVELLGNSMSCISIDTLSFKLQASPEDVKKVVERFSHTGMVRFDNNQIYLTEAGLSKVA